MLLWLSDARGIYIPQKFAESFSERAKHVSGVTDEQWGVLEQGPDHESYWDVWQEVCDSAVVTDNEGHKFTIRQDGDCWLVPVGMEWNDEQGTFMWPEDMAQDDD